MTEELHRARPKATRPAAVLLDMDGTLVDSHGAVESAWTTWAIENGLDVDEVIAFCHGRTGEATIRRFRPDLSESEIEADDQLQLERECADLDGVRIAPGAHDLLAWFDEAGIPWAVVTNAPRQLADARLGATGITPTTLVCVDDVEQGKPAPDSYLRGAALLSVDPANCIAVEDSASGLPAAQAAGTRTVAVGGLTGADHDCAGLPDLLAILR